MADVEFAVGIEASELSYLRTLQTALNNFKNATALVTKVVQEQNNETGDLTETYTVQLSVLEQIKGKMIAINKEYQTTIKLNKELHSVEVQKQKLITKGITPAEIENERKVNSIRRERNREAAKISQELKLHDPIFDILADPNNQKLSAQMSSQISRLSKEFIHANITAEEFKNIVYDIIKSGPEAFDKLPDQFKIIGERALNVYKKIEDNKREIETQKESSIMIDWTKKKQKIVEAYGLASSIKEKENLDLLITKMSTIHKLSGLTKDNFYKLFSQVFKDGTINLDKLNEKEKQVARYALEVRNKTDSIISKSQRSKESKELFQSLITRVGQIKTVMTDSEVEKFNRLLITSRKFYENSTMTKEQFTSLFKDVLLNGIKNFNTLTDEQREAANHFLKLNDMLNVAKTRYNRRKEGKEFVESVMKQGSKFTTGMTDSEIEKFNKIVIASRKFYQNSTLTKEQFTSLFKDVLLNGIKNFNNLTDEQRAIANHFLKLKDMMNISKTRSQRSTEAKDFVESVMKQSSKFTISMTDSEVEKFNKIVIASKKFYENSTLTKQQFSFLFKNVFIKGMTDFSKMKAEALNIANHFLKLRETLLKSGIKTQRTKESDSIAEALQRGSLHVRSLMSNKDNQQFIKMIEESKKLYVNSNLTRTEFEKIFYDIKSNGVNALIGLSEESRKIGLHFLTGFKLSNKTLESNFKNLFSNDVIKSILKLPETSIISSANLKQFQRFQTMLFSIPQLLQQSSLSAQKFKSIFEQILKGKIVFSGLNEEEKKVAAIAFRMKKLLKEINLTKDSQGLEKYMLSLTTSLSSTRQVSQIQALFKNISSSIKSGKYSLSDFIKEFSRLRGPESAIKILSTASNDLQIDIGRLKTAMEGKAGTGTAGGGGGGPLGVLGELMTPKGLLGVFRLQLVHRIFGSLINSIQNGAKEAAQFDAKLIRIKTITQEINISDYEWKTRLLDISKKTGTGSIETLDAAYKLFSNNIAKSIKSLNALQEALIFGKITNSTAEASIDLLSFTLNAFKINVSESERVLGILFKTIDLGNITAQEMANTLGMTAPLAKQLGISLEEFSTAAVVITQQGVSFETANTLIRNVVKEMINPTETMKTLFQEWGVNSGEAAIKTFGFYGVLLKLRQEIDKGGTTRLGELIEDMRSLVAVPALAGKGNLELFKSTQLAMASASDTYTKAKDLVNESSSTIFNKALNRITIGFTKIGAVIYDTISDLFRSDLGKLTIDVFEKMLKDIETVGLAIEALILTILKGFDLLSEQMPSIFSSDIIEKYFSITQNGLKDYIKTLRDSMAEERKRSTINLKNLDQEIEKTKELIKQKENKNNFIKNAINFAGISEVMKLVSLISGVDVSVYSDKNLQKDKNRLKELEGSREIFAPVKKFFNSNELDNLKQKLEQQKIKIIENAAIEENKILQQKNKIIEDQSKEEIRIKQNQLVEIEKLQTKIAELENKKKVFDQENQLSKIDRLKNKIAELENKNLELAEATKNRTKGLVANIKMLFQDEDVEMDKVAEKQKEKFKKISEDVIKKKEELKNKFVEEEITKRLDVDGGIFAKLKIVGGVVFALKQQARDFFNIRNIDEARNKFDTIRNILTDINKDLRSGIKKSMEEITRIQIEMEDEAFKRSIEKKSKGTKDRMIKNRIQEIMTQAAQTIDIEESRKLFQKAAGLAGDLQADPKGQTIRQIREMQIQKEQQFIEFAKNAMLDEAALLRDRLNLEDNILAQETNINAQIERSLEIYKNIYAEQEKTLNLRKEELDVLNKQLQAILDAEGRKRTQVLPQEASVPAFATGGRLGIDNLIARVSPGEMIMSTAATNNWRPVLTAMNAGMFNNGGSTTTVGDINITMNQSGSAQTDVRELAGLLRRELRRGTIRLG